MARAALHDLPGEEDQDNYSPEGLLISAFLETGSFNPEKHHIDDDDIEAWAKLWQFGREHQKLTGYAPPMSIVKDRFPDFELVPDVNPHWAAQEVLRASDLRRLRHAMHSGLAAVKDDDADNAFSVLEGLRRRRGHSRAATSVLDHAAVSEEFDVTKIEVPYPTLQRATGGGIGQAELWYFAARLGLGKTSHMLDYAATAAKAGARVCIHSLEMPYRQVAWRSALRLANRDKVLVDKLRKGDVLEKKEALDEIAHLLPGCIDVLDPSHGPINTVGSVKESCHEYDLVIVDHVGLLRGSDGKRAIEDWRVMATISNVLRETTLEVKTPILGIAQINRGGEKHGKNTPPKAADLAQSDALGQDADVLITMSEPSERTRVHSAEKVRNGPSVKWWTRFDYERNDFGEVSKEMMEVIKMEDQDRAERFG